MTLASPDTDPEACCPAAAASCCHRYAGKLSNSGDRLTLLDASQQIIERVRYRSARPWAEAADGYGRSLERISPSLPADDAGSWLASAAPGGTPGQANGAGPADAEATAGVYVTDLPVADPPQPVPGVDAVLITVQLDGPRVSAVTGVDLIWELATPQGNPPAALTAAMASVPSQDGSYSVTIQPGSCAGGNCMLRYALRVAVQGAVSALVLPSPLDPQPCWSLFVTSEPLQPADGGHRMIIWGYQQRTPTTGILPPGQVIQHSASCDKGSLLRCV